MTNPVTIELNMTATNTSLKFVTPEISIRRYKSCVDENSIYVAGVEARIKFLDLVGVKNSRVVPVSEPNAEPYLIMLDKNRNGQCRFFLSNGEVYYDIDGKITFLDYDDRPITKRVDRLITKRVDRLRDNKPVAGTCAYRQENGTMEWEIVLSSRKKLTLLHQQVAKHVFDIFLEKTRTMRENAIKYSD